MEEDGFAAALMSEERKKWQDPLVVIKAMRVKAGMRVADLGCGPGFFTIPLADAVGDAGADQQRSHGGQRPYLGNVMPQRPLVRSDLLRETSGKE